MFVATQDCLSDSSHAELESLLHELSRRWIVVEWENWPASKRDAAAALVEVGAAELQIRCVMQKEDVPPPLEAIVGVSGDYWEALYTRLTEIAHSVPQWNGQPGAIRLKTSKVAARLSESGTVLQNDWRSEVLTEIAPPYLTVESCQFADGTPLHGHHDPTREAEVSWTLDAKQATAPAEAPSRSTADEELPPKRSWRQSELDTAIAAYRDDPSNEFMALQDLIQSGSQTAYKQAKQRFGRNAIVRKLGVRSPAMVTNSHIWQGIAATLDLPRGRHGARPLRDYEQMPLAALADSLADESSDVVDDLVRREMPEVIDGQVEQAKLKFSTGEEAARFSECIKAIKCGVELRRLSPEKAEELVTLTIEQAREQHRHRIRQRPY